MQFFLEGASKADIVVRLSLLMVVVVVTVAAYYSSKLGHSSKDRKFPLLLATYAIGQILFNVYLWFNHVNFPLNLEAMELLRLQHLQRLMNHLPLYPEPSSDFIALAYNPLSYLITVPFAYLFGDTLFTMRLVAILGMAIAGIIIFLTVRRHTASNWWGLIALGLFAAAYRTMDCYLDTAHADSGLLSAILLGCYILERSQSRLLDHLGLLCFILAFWLKQQGSIFAIAAIVYLTWRHGLRQAGTFWLMGSVLGVGLYLAMPDWALGPRFHYFTWQVPRQWVEVKLGGLKPLVRLILVSYPALAIASLAWLKQGRQSQQTYQPNIWYFMGPIALLSGVLASFTPGSNDNVYIPLGTWLIIIGTLGLQRLKMQTVATPGPSHLLAISLSFALLAYNPFAVIVPSSAAAAYQDFVSYLRALPGTIYAPWIGALPEPDLLSPTVHWVPLDDILRGPGINPKAQPPIANLLQPVLQPSGPAYVLHNYPLAQDDRLSFLQDSYVLDQDLGARFHALSTLPRRYQLNYPRYLYRYVGPENQPK